MFIDKGVYYFLLFFLNMSSNFPSGIFLLPLFLTLAGWCCEGGGEDGRLGGGCKGGESDLGKRGPALPALLPVLSV